MRRKPRLPRAQLTNLGSNVNVRFEGEDVWLTAEQLQQLFQASQQDVSHHIQQIYADGELLAEATNKKYLLVRNEGNRSVSRNILALSQGRGQNSEAMQNRIRRVPRRGVGKRGVWPAPARRGRLGYDALPSPTLRQYPMLMTGNAEVTK